VSLFQQSGKGGDLLQRELLEKQREIEMMLDERNEKERLLIEALRKQAAERQGPPILAPTLRTTTTTTTTATTQSTTTIATTTTREEIEDFRSLDVVEEEGDEEDENYKVEIILEMTRGLVEATHQQRLNSSEERTEFSEDLFGKPFPEKPATPLEAIVNAREAVLKTMRSGNERTSPAVWAAVEILSDFVDSQQPGIPSDVLIAIIQLTEFLNAEDIKEDGDDVEEENVQAEVEVQQRFIHSTTTEKQILLSPLQIKLRDRLLKQKVMKQQEIDKIIERSKQKKQPTSSSKFPGRIKLMEVSSESQEFSFSTLPIY